MSDHSAIPSDRDLDRLLAELGDSVDVPSMVDSLSRARRQIEARGAADRRQEPGVPLSPPRDERAAAFQPKEILQLPLDEQESKTREFALLAVGLAAAAIVGLVLAFVFRGFGDDEKIVDYWPADEFADHPLAAEPYDLPGYEFAGAIGRSAVPNEPVDVAIGPDGTQFVLDQGLSRVVAFTADGEVRTDWGDEGYSVPISDPGVDAIGAGSDGQVYVALTDVVLVFDAAGRQIDSWPFPKTANAETRIRRSQGLVVDSAGDVFVAGRGLIWRFEAETGAATTIAVGSETDFQLAIDGQDQLYAASWPGGIYRVSLDGELELVGRTKGQDDINGFAVAPDGRFVVFRSSRGGDEPSTIIILDGDGAEAASWPITRNGQFMGNLGPYWIGIEVTDDGTIVLPDYLGHRISLYDSDGTLVSEIRDDAPEAFGRLWRIAIDGDGNVLGYDPSTEPRVVRFAPDGELLQNMPFDAPLLGAMASLFNGNAFTATADGGFVVAPQQFGPVSFYSPQGELLRQWEQGSLESEAGIAIADAIAVDDQGFVYLVDEGFAGRLFDNLRKFTSDGEFVAEVGSIGYPARADIVYHDGAIWVVDDGAIVRFPADGGEPLTIARSETEEGERELPGLPLTLAIDPDGNILTYMFKLDGEPGQFPTMLAKLDTQGNVIWTADLAEHSGNRYVDLAIAADGTLYLSDSELRQILVYRPTSESDVIEPGPTEKPEGEAVERLLPVDAAPEIAGFDFTGYIGESTVPNEPSDAVGTADGRVFVSDQALDRVIAFGPDGEIDRNWGDGGLSAHIPEPTRLALDPDGVPWVSTFGGEIYRLDDPANPELVWRLPAGGQVWGFVFDSTGSFYLANAAAGELVSPAADGSVNVLATIPRETADLTIDSDDRLYLVAGVEQVVVYDKEGSVIDRWSDAALGQVRSVNALPNGNIAVAQRNDDPELGLEIVILSPEGDVIDSWHTEVADNYVSNTAIPSLGTDPDGHILVPDLSRQLIAVYDAGNMLRSLAADDDHRFAQVGALTTGPDGDLYVVDGLARRAQRFTPGGELVATYDFSDLGRRLPTFDPHDIAVDSEGRVYLATYSGQQIAVFAPDGTRISSFIDPPRVDFEDETSLFFPYGVGLAADGTLLVTDEQSGGDIKRFTPEGEFLDHWPTSASGSLYLRFEVHLDRVYVHRKDGFDVFDLEGALVGEIPYDGDVWAFDIDDDGNLYITGLLPLENRQDQALTFEFARLSPDGEIIERLDLGLSVQVPSIAVAADGSHLYIASGLSRQILAYARR